MVGHTIPPGFQVIGEFNNEFEHFKDRTDYNSWEDFDHKKFNVTNWGVSKRWKNPHIRTRDIVCGFDFKIGPEISVRYTFEGEGAIMIKKVLGANPQGDIQIHFPRRLRPREIVMPGGETAIVSPRGSYVAKLNWYLKDYADDVPVPRIADAMLDKEIPHPNYGDFNYLRLIPPYTGEANPRDIEQIDIRDGQWHSFLAAVYNDWHRDGDLKNINPDTHEVPLLSTSSEYPTIELWYAHKPSVRIEDYMFLGRGIDLGNMPPREPLFNELGEGGELFGDDPFAPEHPLQIRIDDVPLDQIEIRSMYAAPVRYVGIGLQNHVGCLNQSKALNDAIANVKRLEQEGRTTEIPNAMSNLRTVEYRYLKCVAKHIIVNPDVGIKDCTELENQLNQAKMDLETLKENINSTQAVLDEAIQNHQAARIKKLRERLANMQKQLPGAEKRVETAQRKLDVCKKSSGEVTT